MTATMHAQRHSRKNGPKRIVGKDRRRESPVSEAAGGREVAIGVISQHCNPSARYPIMPHVRAGLRTAFARRWKFVVVPLIVLPVRLPVASYAKLAVPGSRE